jgi:5'-nucleotidase
LDFSGANQVVLNIVQGRMHESNVVVLSPKVGTFAARFVESGAAVRVGVLRDILNEIRDVFCIIANTIMTADIVVEMSERPHPVVWILHEWWDDEMIIENLRIRNYEGLTLNTVKQALAKAAMVVCVCESQRKLYNPSAPSSVIFVGVPDPLPRIQANMLMDATPDDFTSEAALNNATKLAPNKPFTFLCLGIICPRKNQLWTVQLFKKFAKDKPNVRLQVVGARYTRVYEIEYLEQVKAEIGDDPRIELYDVTEDVDRFYRTADCLMLTSLNEVTPMVISEALSWSIPVISTNIAGIKEMFTDGVEGYHFPPDDEEHALFGMEQVYSNHELREKMKKAGRARFETTFDLDIMVESYRQLVMKVAPPVVLLDMDGALIDWDKGFLLKWADRAPLDRSKSYFIEKCVSPEFQKQAEQIFHAKGFFENLEPMDGALQAVKEMERDGLRLYICTAPVKSSNYCAQEKLNWVREHLGEHWLDRVILCQDKTMVAGDLLIDDKPYEYLSPGGKHTTATWKQIIFDAPYNRQLRLPRMFRWSDWRAFVYPMLGRVMPSELLSFSQDEAEGKVASGDYYQRSVPMNISVPRLRRDSSFSSVHSSMSLEDVQKQLDMFQFGDSTTPLNPEDFAMIRSGTASLAGDDTSDDESLYEGKASSFLTRNSEASDAGGGSSILGSLAAAVGIKPAVDLAEKKKALHDRLQERSEEYRRKKEIDQKKMALESTEAADFEGVQLFRPSYDTWKKQGQPLSKSNTPLPPTDVLSPATAPQTK